MTECLLTPAEREALNTGIAGIVDRLAEALFPWLYPDARDCNPCVDHDHLAADVKAGAECLAGAAEPELEAGG